MARAQAGKSPLKTILNGNGERLKSDFGIRVGQGFDIHQFADKQNILSFSAELSFPGERSLVGHSGADVPAHAITDALLSALQLGDLGERFPTPTRNGPEQIQSRCCEWLH